MDIISEKMDMCYLVWKNAILAPGDQGRWFNSNMYLGGKWGVEEPVQKMVAWHTMVQKKIEGIE